MSVTVTITPAERLGGAALAAAVEAQSRNATRAGQLMAAAASAARSGVTPTPRPRYS